MRLLPLQEKELAQAAKERDKPRKRVVYRSVAEIRAELIARGLPVHKVDMLMSTQSPNVINGPFKTRDVDDSSER
jgi:DNA polymerase III alpha subunit (gram-positive type)